MGPWRRLVVLRRVIVNLKDGGSMTGVLYRQEGALLVLREAVFYEPGRDGVPIDGEAIIERNEVLFVQVPPGREG